jgi:predicted AlkP superfamily phosphohydrolase/phosphomutase
MPETIVVGLDGAGMELLEPWIENGDLPALERVLESGVRGELEPVLPPVTSPNWKAYATGKNPGKLGIFWWHNVDVENERVYMPVERYHQHDEYWELLAEDRDEEVGVVGVPTTYPPKSFDGYLVSGPPDGRETDYTHPPWLAAELEDRFEYKVSHDALLEEGTPEACEEVLEIIDARFEAGKYLLEEYSLSFLQVTTFYINALHHNFWDHEYTKRGWELIDDHLADLLERDCDLVLMSDHGHAAIGTTFNVNAWLEREGYLTYDAAVADALHGLGVNTGRIKRALDVVERRLPGDLDVRSTAEAVAPQWVLNRLPDESGELGGSKHEMADWETSDAVASAQGPVYLTVDRSDPRYDALRSELVDALSSVTDPDGRPVATDVYAAEEVYAGPYLEEAPDVVFDKAPHVNVREGFGADEVFPDEDPDWEGVNTRKGLFAATGPSFGEGTVEDLSILDLAPTLLALHGLDAPADVDGSVRRSVFADVDEPPSGAPRVPGGED